MMMVTMTVIVTVTMMMMMIILEGYKHNMKPIKGNPYPIQNPHNYTNESLHYSIMLLTVDVASPGSHLSTVRIKLGMTSCLHNSM